MYFVEGRLTGVLAELATAGVLAFCSTRDDRATGDADLSGPPAVTVPQATTGPIQPRITEHSMLASRTVGRSVLTRGN
jgi:hypothetical protein